MRLQVKIDHVFMLTFGIMGFLLRKFEYEMAPLVLAFILGPMAENALRQSLIISQGSLLIFLSRPIPFIALMMSFFLIVYHFVPFLRKRRKVISSLEN
jgi:putative tricarboxylic transport membrane protein